MISIFRGRFSTGLKSIRSKKPCGLNLEMLEKRDCPANGPLIPLLEVPGFTGSLPSGIGVNEWFNHRGTQPSQLRLNPAEYEPLLNYLRDHNYKTHPGYLHQVPYDWRLPLAPEDGIVDGIITGITGSDIAKSDGDVFTTCLDYLGYSLKKVAETWLLTNPGQPLKEVDVVAHSMGNLLVRAYVQSSAYGGTFTTESLEIFPLPKIRNFIQMAPPNLGSPIAFPVWMGDDKILVVPPGEGYAEATHIPKGKGPDGLNLALSYVKSKFNAVATNELIINGPVPITRDSILVDGSPSAEAFIRQYCPSLGTLVPTYDFVKNPDGSITGVQNNTTFAVPSIIYDLNKGGGKVDLPPFVEKYNLIYGTGVETVDLAESKTNSSGTWYPLPDTNTPILRRPSLAVVSNGQTYYNMTAKPSNGDGIVPLISLTNVVTKDYVSHYPQIDPKINHFNIMTNPAVITQVGEILDDPSGTIDTKLVEINRQVGNLFQLALGRNPEPGALKSWGDAIASGRLSVAQATDRIFHSDEHFHKAVTSSFQLLLNRDPNPVGLNLFVQAMKNGLTENKLVASILGSQEFNLGLTDQAYVQKLYETVLGRDSDAEGNSDHLNGLKLGVTRQNIAEGFLQSREHNENVVDHVFETILGRTASDSEQAVWVRHLEKPSVDELDVTAQIAGSPEGVSQSRTLTLGKPESKDELQKWVDFLNKYPNDIPLVRGW